MDEARPSLFDRLRRLLPLLMIMMIQTGMVMFAVSNVVPPLRIYTDLSKQLDDGQKLLAQMQASDTDTDIVLLERQISNTQDVMKNTAAIFMTEDQADEILDRFYSYADESNIEIVSLQTQQTFGSTNSTDSGVVESATIYSIRAFRLQIAGGIAEMMRFITRVREAMISGIVITNFTMRDTTEVGSTLQMDVLIYTSPLSDGTAYADLLPVNLPGPTTFDIPPTAVPVIETPAPTLTPGLAPTSETASSTGADVLPPEPPLALLFDDRFDEGKSDRWNLGAGWSLVDDNGNPMLQVSNSTSELTYIYNTLKDVALQARVLLDKGSVRMSVRQSAAGRYSAVLDALGRVSLYRGNDLIQSAVVDTSGVARWREMRLSVVDGVVRVSVDGQMLIAATDSVELPPGTVSFALVEAGTTRVDDIEVWTLNAAIAPTTTATATVAP